MRSDPAHGTSYTVQTNSWDWVGNLMGWPARWSGERFAADDAEVTFVAGTRL